MEDLIELLCLVAFGIVTMVVYATWYGLVFLCLSGMAIFSVKYRHKLRDRWRCSVWEKFLMVLGTSFYLSAFVWAGCFWWDVAFTKPVEAETIPYLPLTREEASDIMDTKTIPQLMERLGKVKRRLAEEAAKKK